MLTEEQFEQLEQEEYEEALATLALIFLLIDSTSEQLSQMLYGIYNKYGTDGVLSWLATGKVVGGERLRTKLWRELDDLLNNLFIETEVEFRKCLEKIVRMEFDTFGVELSDDELQKILDFKWGADDLNWVDRLWERAETTLYELGRELKQDLVKRNSAAEVTSEKEEQLEKLKRAMRSLLVTERTAIGSYARYRLYKELGINKYVFYASEDERVCEHCGALHGMEFPLSAWEVGVTASPIHPRCRCWEIPALD